MKKVMLAAAIAALGVAAKAEVSSAVVGYSSTDMAQAKYMMFAPQFVDVTTQEAAMDAIVSNVPGVDWDEDSTYVNTATILQVFDGTKYTTYYYLNDGAVSETETKPGWCNSAGDIVDLVMTPGTSAWIRLTPGEASVVASGAVEGSDSVSVACPVGYTMCANAFPTELKLNSTQFVADGIQGVDWDEQSAYVNTAPVLQVFDGSKYTTYYYLNDGAVSETETKPGWCNSAGDIVDVSIPVNTGFWVNARTGAFTLEFSL